MAFDFRMIIFLIKFLIKFYILNLNNVKLIVRKSGREILNRMRLEGQILNRVDKLKYLGQTMQEKFEIKINYLDFCANELI